MWLFCGDLHLTDHARDEYRFGIFEWIKRQQQKRPVAATFLAGDITDSKDRHSATLVNKIVAGLTQLQPPVYIDMGNHDYRDHQNPFFKFLNHIEGITFVTKPTVIRAGRPIAIIPHYRTQDEFDAAVHSTASSKPVAFLVHQTFDGAIAESGVCLTGLSASLIESMKPPLGIYAGDVHKPQTQGKVTYVGCPYNVRFGDDFDPRSLWVSDSGNHTDLKFTAPRKWSLVVRGPENIYNNKDLYEGDQVKLTIELAREEAVEWKEVKRQILGACKELGLEIHGVRVEVNTITTRKSSTKSHSNADIYDQFCTAENVASQIKQMGRRLLDGNEDIL
jgi:DNA repair exonuclease SbcCD nuclease subunit